MARKRLGEILIEAGLLDESGLQRALNEQQRWGGGPLGQYLVQQGLINEETLVRALSRQFNLPAVALDPSRLDAEVAKAIPQEICERYRLICFNADPDMRFLDVAMSDPASLDAIEEVRAATHYGVRPYFATPSALERAIGHIFHGSAEIDGTLEIGPLSDAEREPSPEVREVSAIGDIHEATPPPSPPPVGSDERGPAKPTPPPPPSGASSKKPPLAAMPRKDGSRVPLGTSGEGVEPAALPADPGGPTEGYERRIVRLEAAIEKQERMLKALLDALEVDNVISSRTIRRLRG